MYNIKIYKQKFNFAILLSVQNVRQKREIKWKMEIK